MAGTKISEATLRETLKGTENIPLTDTDLPAGRTTPNALKNFIKSAIGNFYFFNADNYFNPDDAGFGNGDGFVPENIRDELREAITSKTPIIIYANNTNHLVEYSQCDGEGSEVSITLIYHEFFTDNVMIDGEPSFTGSAAQEATIEISPYLDILISYNYVTPALYKDVDDVYTNYFLDISGEYKKIDVSTGVNIVNHGTSDTTFTMTSTPTTYHVWGEISTLNISFNNNASNKLAEYMFEFKSGATPTVLTLPNAVKWVGSHDIQPNMTYQVSIVNNIGIMVGIPNTTEETV